MKKKSNKSSEDMKFNAMRQFGIEEMTQYYVTYIYIVTYILLYAKEETSKDDNFLWWFSILPKQGAVFLSPLHIDLDLIFVQKLI